MSLDMYNFIVEHKHRIPVIDTDNGLIVTVRGSNGSVCTTTGYRRLKVNNRTLQVHQVLAVVLFGDECVGKQINHLDGNKLNNKKENLELCTQSENIRHAFRTGLYDSSMSALLELNKHNRKLTDNNVRFIRENHSKSRKDKSRLSSYKLGEMLGVNKNTILNVANNILYQEVK